MQYDRESGVGIAERLMFIDGLRGLAALGVVLFHFAGHRIFVLPLDGVKGVLHAAVRCGHIGVPLFFVISGFVVAHSVGQTRVSVRYIGHFAARRMIRLAPPYWGTILLIVLTTYLGQRAVADYTNRLPSVGCVLAHMGYVYPFLGYQPMEEIFWTLVHEVQFYLLYAVLFGCLQQWSDPKRLSTVGVVVLFGVPAVLSACSLVQATGLCINTWYMFCLGVLAYWWHRRWISSSVCATVLCCIAGSLVVDATLHKLTAVTTAGSILAASRLQAMGVWLTQKPFQFLGRISYSLYLLHGVVGWRVLSVAERISDSSTQTAVAWSCAAVVVSILAAWVMYYWLERPSILLSRRWKYTQQNSAASPSATLCPTSD